MFEEWKGVLALATMWKFDEVRDISLSAFFNQGKGTATLTPSQDQGRINPSSDINSGRLPCNDAREPWPGVLRPRMGGNGLYPHRQRS